MLITHVELENFKSYAHETVTFSPGTNAITGLNGSGKSTLLEAIGFVLFNHLEAGLKLSSLLREGSESGSVVVGLISSHDERAYDVERRFSAKSTLRYRVYDRELGVCLHENADDVRAWLHEHLHVEREADLATLFQNTIGVPQGTFTAPFLETPSTRKLIFDPLLQVEEYKQASDALRETVNYLAEQAGAIREEVARLEGQLAALPGLEEEARALAASIADLEARDRTLARDLAEALANLETLDRAERRLQEAERLCQQAQEQVAGRTLLLGEAQRAVQEAEAARAQVEAARAGHAAFLQAEGQWQALDRQRSTRDQLQKQRAQLETEQARLAARLEQLERDLSEIAAAAIEMARLAPAVQRQDALEQSLAAAQDEARRLTDLRERAVQAEIEVTRAQADLAAQQQGLQTATALEKDLIWAQTRLAEVAEADRQARETRAAALAEGERLRKQSATLQDVATARCPVCEAELTPAHRAELLARVASSSDALDAQVQALGAQLDAHAQESRNLAAQVERGQKRLRALPSLDAVRRAEEALARAQALGQQVQEGVAALADAPQRAAAQRAALAELGDPRRDYQRCEDRASQRAARERAQADALAQAQELAVTLAQTETQLAPYVGLDAALRAAQEARTQHQAAHNTYLAHLSVAQQVDLRCGRVEQIQAELAELERSLANLSAQHRAALAAYDAGQHALARQRTTALQQEAAGVQAQLAARRERLEAVQRDIRRLHALQHTLATRQTDLHERDALRSLVESVRELLRKAGPYVTQQLVRQISREASTLFADIMGDHSARLNWSEDYELSLEVKGLRRTFRQLSGGEQMSAALALRLALLRQTSAIDIAFFDEPTAHLDPERREGLAEKITQVKGFAQLFVISHDDTFERAAQNYIRIVKDEHGSRWERD